MWYSFGMTYFFETYGCQMNLAESAAAEQKLINRGWARADSEQTADLVVINTCSVRATAESRVFGRLGYYAGLKAVRAGKAGAKSKSLEEAARFVKDGARPIKVAVMGCMAERLSRSLKRDYPVVDYVIGTFAKNHLDDMISEIENELGGGGGEAFCDSGIVKEDAFYAFAAISSEAGAFSTFVPIMNGCDNFCSYCIVPFVRGRETSRALDEVIAEVDELSRRGVKEITLLGQNVNSYRGLRSKSEDSEEVVLFPELLRAIAFHLKEIGSSIEWVRFDSSHPKDFSDELIDVIGETDVVCKSVHLALQHGSDKILRAMNRHYTQADFLALVEKLRKKIPNVSLSTDVMVGFPGESEADFEELFDLMSRIRFKNAFMYYFNPREGTAAARMKDQIPLAEKKARLQRIIDLQLKITQEELTARLGATEKVLAEKLSKDNAEEILARTDKDERVALKGSADMIGSFALARFDSLNGNTFKGTIIARL